jgi:hypothetical protein
MLKRKLIKMARVKKLIIIESYFFLSENSNLNNKTQKEQRLLFSYTNEINSLKQKLADNEKKYNEVLKNLEHAKR